ncbi:MAG: DNA topoisomerase IV subunit A [Gammaproteobacteria bacterium]|nr:DNA topoisomerase IV subunit A [Gammaproteobacteria bacterium]|tara:strand:+ start:180659 stop:182914 length:2256 start_codon:yes stop_codon:yes gene_type:complete
MTKKDSSLKTTHNNIEKLSVKDFTEQAYLNYSMYVILDRALPNIADGLKPVQRRILFAMNELSLKSTSKFKKSARTIGDVLGKFHPHGDTACYEAMVMMAQPFSYNHPFINGQGNWGTQDDPKSFAAMRYTESRLTEFSDLLLDEIRMGTVDWNLNFDGTLEEPQILPSMIPNILINGSSGIAVGMSTDIPSHNLSEVLRATIALLDKPKSSIKEIRSHLIGPDFPTGGELISNDSELNDIYEHGTGNIKIRATYSAKGKEIVINSIPYQATISKIIEQIQEQIYTKKTKFIDSIEDESDQEHPVRLVLRTKGRSFASEDVMSHLFYTTDLEKNYRVNMNMIGLNGKPQVKNIIEIISEWIKFRKNTITRKLEWELDKVKKRIHILKAYIIVYTNLNDIIKIIRNKDNPKVILQKRYKFTDTQYDAIIDMKIRSLAKLHEIEINKELDILSTREKDISSILSSKAKLTKLIKDNLKNISQKYHRERVTNIVQSQPAKAIKILPTISKDPVSIILSKNGWVKVVKGHDIDLKLISYKTGDNYLSHITSNLNEQISFFDQRGSVYSVEISNLPLSRGHGEPLSKFFAISDGTSFVGLTNIDKNKAILNASSQGYGFVCLYEDIIAPRKKGKVLLRTKDSNALHPVTLDLDVDNYYIVITSENYMLIGELKELPILNKGKGVKLINLSNTQNETIIFLGILRNGQSLSIISETKRTKTLDFEILKKYIMKRTRRGKKIEQKFLHRTGKSNYNIN